MKKVAAAKFELATQEKAKRSAALFLGVKLDTTLELFSTEVQALSVTSYLTSNRLQ
jgi:hypothetical protein